MNCPKCKSALGPNQVNFLLELDICASCCGVWFDQQEIYAKVKRSTQFYEVFKKAYQKATKTDLPCPRDNEPMIQTTVEDISLPFEACEKCGGMWFDKGEVEKLNEFLKNYTGE